MSNSSQPPSGKGNTGARVVAIVIGLLFLMVGVSLLLQGLQSNNQITIILGLFLFTLFLSSVSAAVRVPVPVPIFRTVTVAKCSKCEYAEVRDFQRGDYFYKVLGKCKDCDGDMYVKSIYNIPVQKTQLSSS